MCFYNDCEWTAEVNEASLLTSGPATKCDECHEPIAPEAWRRTIHQQEHELCQICEDECSSEFVSQTGVYDERIIAADILRSHTCYYGETFDYVCCETCFKVLESIKEHEQREGCPVDAQQPSLCGLWEELSEHDEAATYIREAVAKFPEIATHRDVARFLARAEAAQ